VPYLLSNKREAGQAYPSISKAIFYGEPAMIIGGALKMAGRLDARNTVVVRRKAALVQQTRADFFARC